LKEADSFEGRKWTSISRRFVYSLNLHFSIMGSISSSLQSNGSGSGSSEGSKQSPDVPVLIIGGGPTGLLQANLLAQLGGTAMSL
jgi:hypothetical protein